MLAEVTEVLRERNLLGPADEPSYNITIVTADTVNIRGFTRDDESFHIRVKKWGTAPAEYENYRNAWCLFPRHVPEPLGRYLKNEWEIIVVRGIQHEPVFAGNVARNSRRIVRQVISFLEASSKVAAVDRPVQPHRAYLRELRERTADPSCAAIVEEWIAIESVDSLPHIRQHGDFVVNNLGYSGSELTVFDWEDFGGVSFPGLDLCTLVASDTLFSAEVLRDLIQRTGRVPDNYLKLIDAGCRVMALTPDLFCQLIPLYLVMFLDLKRNYGEGIRTILNEVVSQIRRGICERRTDQVV